MRQLMEGRDEMDSRANKRVARGEKIKGDGRGRSLLFAGCKRALPKTAPKNPSTSLPATLSGSSQTRAVG